MANKIADQNVILIIYFCIFILLIPLLKSYLNSQHLQNIIFYIGTTFCRHWAIKSCFYSLHPVIFTIAKISSGQKGYITINEKKLPHNWCYAPSFSYITINEKKLPHNWCYAPSFSN